MFTKSNYQSKPRPQENDGTVENETHTQQIEKLKRREFLDDLGRDGLE
jgi:hypothetical protein